MRRNTFLLAGAAALVLAFGSCGGGSSKTKPTNFNAFVNSIATTQSDTAEPVDVNGTQFTFSEDPAAFDALFQ